MTYDLTHSDLKTFTASPDEHHSLVNFSGCGGTRDGDSLVISALTDNCEIKAEFQPKLYKITSNLSGQGSISPAAFDLAYGDSKTFTATPDKHHSLLSISGCGGTRDGDSLVISELTNNCEIIAEFQPKHTIFTVKDTTEISRNYFDGYDIDDIHIVHHTPGMIELVNNTPRYVHHPLIQLDDSIVKVNKLIAPFTRLHIELPTQFSEKLSKAHFIEEQPFFKAKVKEYVDIKPAQAKYAMPTELNTYQYEKEIRGLKQVFNNYSYNYEFISFIEGYMNKSLRFSRQFHEDEWCETHDTVHTRALSPSDDDISFKPNDNSENTVKHISMLANKPRPSTPCLRLQPTESQPLVMGGSAFVISDCSKRGQLARRPPSCMRKCTTMDFLTKVA
ncbi:hypothetical protein CS022_12365 [Veronia nyctiphanis]|uniref:Bacterial repeat domain-containing protein n=1 Tax=Veronia nyctiphanis TaxID=1278244 RepID=A0A4Q0YPT6_9GAMM|nr:hypothetical protein [Veronia nyctiphanis]RXJ73067.1 hypothetical protein CS022_12365 [Veronia nyctiphanis]